MSCCVVLRHVASCCDPLFLSNMSGREVSCHAEPLLCTSVYSVVYKYLLFGVRVTTLLCTSIDSVVYMAA